VSVEIRLATPDEIPRLEPLWRELYAHQAGHGMLLQLPESAFDAWVASIAPFVGRFAVVVVALDGREAVGFVAGRVRSLPPYFGAGQVGAIGEVYVREHHRGGGLGRRLVERAVEWYRENGLSRVELQVVAGNPEAVRFYERIGWTQELVQMVWTEPGER
jgi:GNAT superfamily N-acetyltransferase